MPNLPSGLTPTTPLTVSPIPATDHLTFIHTQPAPSISFLQTPAWANVKTEWRSESLGWFNGRQLCGTALVLYRPIPLPIPLHLPVPAPTLAYIPGGPTIDWTSDLTTWLTPLTTYLKTRGAFAIRIAPPVRTTTWTAPHIKEGIADPTTTRLTDLTPHHPDPLGLHVTTHLQNTGWLPQNPDDGFGAGQPQFTFELPLTAKTEEDLLKNMNQLWRRNIKKAAKENVEVTTSTDLKAFHDLYLQTATRDNFTPRPLHYFETMFAAMSPTTATAAATTTTKKPNPPNAITLYLAHHQTDLLAASILIRLGTHAWYTYGASSAEKRNVRASNACQWAMIRDSLSAGCDIYDLRGITPTLDADDPHLGLIQFKVGTGGQAVRYVGEWDLPLRPLIYRAFDLYMKRRKP